MGIPITARVSSALEASDVLVDMLAAAEGPPVLGSVPVELVLATTVRALRAGAEVLDGLVSRCSLMSCSCSCSLKPGMRARAHGPGAASAPASASSPSSAAPGSASAPAPASTPHTNPNSNTSVRDPVTILDALKASSLRLLSTVLPALLAHYYAASVPTPSSAAAGEGMGKGMGKGKSRLRPSPNHDQAAAARAMDDVLGGVYALLLAPLVRAFAPVSEGFVSACFCSCSSPSVNPSNSCSSSTKLGKSSSNSTTGTDVRCGSGARAKPPPSRTRPVSASANVHPTTDLRPALLAFLDDMLSVLEDVLVLPSPGPGLGSSAREFSSAPKGTNWSAELTIPGTGHVKTLLALDCVRELERMYLPLRTTIASTRSAEPNHVRVCVQEAGYRMHLSLRGGQIPGLAQVVCQTLGDDSTRLGTAGGAGRAPGNAVPSLAMDGSWSSGVPAPAPAQGHPCASLGGKGMRGAGNGTENDTRNGNFGETVLGVGSGPARANGGETRRSHGPAHHTHAHSNSHTYKHARAEAEAGHCDCDDDDLGKRARMTRLAGKDAAWYLCAVLHRVLPAVSASRACGSSSGFGSDPGSAATGFRSGLGTATAAAPFSGTASEPNMHMDTDMRPPGMGLQAHDQARGQGTTEPENTGTSTGTGTSTSTHTETETETAAEQAVYDSLADLLRRTATFRVRSRLPGRTGSSSQIRTQTRTGPGEEDGPRSRGFARHGASNHGCGSPTTAAAAAAAAAATREGRGVGQDRSLGDLEEGRRDRTGVHADAEGTEGRRTTLTSIGTAAAGQSPMHMGEVERGMLLAVLERAWLGI